VRAPRPPQPLPDFRTRPAPHGARLAAHLRGRAAGSERGMDTGGAAAHRQRAGRARGTAARAGSGRVRHDRAGPVRPPAHRSARGARHPGKAGHPGQGAGAVGARPGRRRRPADRQPGLAVSEPGRRGRT
ncbi:hypothetical protein OY671_012387, partial [Metschnikowia pulcherrima]